MYLTSHCNIVSNFHISFRQTSERRLLSLSPASCSSRSIADCDFGLFDRYSERARSQVLVCASASFSWADAGCVCLAVPLVEAPIEPGGPLAALDGQGSKLIEHERQPAATSSERQRRLDPFDGDEGRHSLIHLIFTFIHTFDFSSLNEPRRLCLLAFAVYCPHKQARRARVDQPSVPHAPDRFYPQRIDKTRPREAWRDTPQSRPTTASESTLIPETTTTMEVSPLALLGYHTREREERLHPTVRGGRKGGLCSIGSSVNAWR